MSYRLILFISALSMLSGVAFPQFYETGQDPSSLKWKQIRTDRFTVIYPENYNLAGIDFARKLHEADNQLGLIFPQKKFRIPVIIHSYTTRSNGYVAWAPKRMEIYPTPEQNSIPLDHHRQLAIHELTHVYQMSSLNKGFSKVMSWALGEQFTGVVAALLPLWYLEGDAVFAESYLTESGRGRSPSFQKELKAIAVEKGTMYKYDKIVNGSYRDYIPDHYQSGYQMVTWAKGEHEPDIFNKALDFTAQQPFTLNPVNLSLRKSAGLRKKTIHKEAFDTLKTIWTKEVSKTDDTPLETVNPDKRDKYINYYSPVIAGNDSIIAIKTSLTDPPRIVLVNPSLKTEKKLLTPGSLYPYYISYADRKLVWVEYQPDKRWENRDYSVIKMMDLRTRKVIRLTRRSRYMSASLSSDGRIVSAIENSISNKNSLVLIDAETGIVIKEVSAPGNAHIQRPQWADGGGRITVIYLTDAGEGIMSFSPLTGQWEIMVEAGKEDLQSTYLRNDSLFFISSLTGTDNIYLRTPDKKVSSLVRTRFGASDFSVNNGNIVFSDYSSDGNSISITNLNKVNSVIGVTGAPASPLLERIDIGNVSAETSVTDSFSPEPYRKWKHLFKFHSWMPFYADLEEIKVDPTAIRPGLTLMTQNYLSTLISTIGYEYSAENEHILHTNVTWKGWYPVFESRLDYGSDALISKSGQTVSDPSEVTRGVSFSNTLSQPLRFSSGRFSQYLRPLVSYEYRNDYVYLKDEHVYDHGQSIFSARVYLSNYYRYAYRDIYPRWAQTFDLSYSFAPFDKDIYGTALIFRSSLYFPGIFKNQGIKFRYEVEDQVTSLYMYGNRVPLARGYEDIRSVSRELYSVDYTLPLAYPDFNLASLLYITRFRTALFYDYSLGTGNSHPGYDEEGNSVNYFVDGTEVFSSFGFELLADFYLFRMPFMISGGIQSSWKSIEETPTLKLLFNIDLFGMSIGRRQL